MERHQAVTLFKEIVGNNLIQPSMVTLEESTPDSYNIAMKGAYDSQMLKEFIAQRRLSLKEDKEKNCCIIYQP